jgi:hypothetical protein
VEFVMSRLGADDYGPDARPLPEIEMAQRATEAFQKYGTLPHGVLSATEVATSAYQAQTGLPWYLLHEAFTHFGQVLGASVTRDPNGNITSDALLKLVNRLQELQSCTTTSIPSSGGS